MIAAFRAEILTVPHDPALHETAGDSAAVQHYPDGLLVVEDGVVVALGHYAALAARYAGVAVTGLKGLLVPGFVDAHVHYPQTDRIAAHGAQLLEWLEQHIFPAEAAFSSRSHADEVSGFFLDELLRNGTTSALVFATVHEASVDALFEAACARGMRIVSGKVLMDLGPENLRDTVDSARAKRGADRAVARARAAGLCGDAAFRADIFGRAIGGGGGFAGGASRGFAAHPYGRKPCGMCGRG